MAKEAKNPIQSDLMLLDLLEGLRGSTVRS